MNSKLKIQTESFTPFLYTLYLSCLLLQLIKLFNFTVAVRIFKPVAVSISVSCMYITDMKPV